MKGCFWKSKPGETTGSSSSPFRPHFRLLASTVLILPFGWRFLEVGAEIENTAAGFGPLTNHQLCCSAAVRQTRDSHAFIYLSRIVYYKQALMVAGAIATTAVMKQQQAERTSPPNSTSAALFDFDFRFSIGAKKVLRHTLTWMIVSQKVGPRRPSSPYSVSRRGLERMPGKKRPLAFGSPIKLTRLDVNPATQQNSPNERIPPGITDSQCRVDDRFERFRSAEAFRPSPVLMAGTKGIPTFLDPCRLPQPDSCCMNRCAKWRRKA